MDRCREQISDNNNVRKRKREDSEELSCNAKVRKFSETNACHQKYSANDRLKVYRSTVAEKKDEIVKVHTLDSVKGVKNEVKNDKKKVDSLSQINKILHADTRCQTNFNNGRSRTQEAADVKKLDSGKQFNCTFGTNVRFRANFGLGKMQQLPSTKEFVHDSSNYLTNRIDTVKKQYNNLDIPAKRTYPSPAAPKRTNDVKSDDKNVGYGNKQPLTSDISKKYSVQDRLKNLKSHVQNKTYSRNFIETKNGGVSADMFHASRNNLKVSFPTMNKRETINIKPEVRSGFSRTRDFVEENLAMDWSPVDDNDVISNIEKMRENVSEIKEYKTNFQEAIGALTKPLSPNTTIFKDIYIVVDTNIFLSHIDVVQQLLATKINGVEVPYVFIPWMVIQELDYIKDGRSGGRQLEKNAQAAIKYINSQLSQKNTNLKGQSVLDASRQPHSGTNADDNILSCCLQVVEKGNRTILLSNDVNLRNKAVINEIEAYSHRDIIQKLNPTQKNRENLETEMRITKVLDSLKALLNFIIKEEMKEAYGDLWEKMALMKNSPWSVVECVERIEKYWQSVFSMNLQKQSFKVLQDLKNYLKANKGYCDTMTVEKVTELSINFCVYLKNAYNKHNIQINECINHIV